MRFDASRPARLRHQLAQQSGRIERVFERRHIPTRVSGGEVTPSSIRFDLRTHLQAGLERVEGIKEELRAVLGALSVQLRGDQGEWWLDVEPGEDEVPVALLDLVDDLAAPEGLTAILGLAEDDRPVLIDLATDRAAHVLVSGGSGAGKSALLRTLAVSLVLARRQSELQLLLFDGGAVAYDEPSMHMRPLEYLPHVLGPVIETPGEVREVLAFLQQEASFRREQRVHHPAIVVLIDDVVALARADRERVGEALATLLQHGAGVGIHLVMSAAESVRPLLGNLLSAYLPIRLVGWVEDGAAARDATGVVDSQAEFLYGAGDFLAISQGTVTNFQAAYVSDYDLHFVLDRLHRPVGAPLLAQPFDPRPRSWADETREPHSFIVDAVRQVVNLDDLPPRRRSRETIEGSVAKPRVRQAASEAAVDPSNGSHEFVGRRPTLYASENGSRPEPRASFVAPTPSPPPAVRDVIDGMGKDDSAPVVKGESVQAQPAVVEKKAPAPAKPVLPAEKEAPEPVVDEVEYVDVDEELFPDPDDDDTAAIQVEEAAPRPRPRPAPGRHTPRSRGPVSSTVERNDKTEDDVIPFE